MESFIPYAGGAARLSKRSWEGVSGWKYGRFVGDVGRQGVVLYIWV